MANVKAKDLTREKKSAKNSTSKNKKQEQKKIDKQVKKLSKEKNVPKKIKDTPNKFDGGYSKKLAKVDLSKVGDYAKYSEEIYRDAYHANNIFTRDEISRKLFRQTFRFGLLNPYGSISTAREYLFFTKPDLHIMEIDEGTGKAKNFLNPALEQIPYWVDLFESRKEIIRSLQLSYGVDNAKGISDPFIHLLQNQVSSNMDLPGLSAEFIDTPVNTYGVGYSYRGSSEGADDAPEFSLEFKDTRYLDTYYFFKTYEEYEKLKHHGLIAPAQKYILNKELHDMFAIYKFIVDEDMETLIYWGKMYGVAPKNLPRDVFSNAKFDDGLSYSIEFKAAFYEDMIPDILADFNSLSYRIYNNCKYQINVYNTVLDHADTRPAKGAAIIKDTTSPAALNSPTGYVYKLKWRGDDKY